MGTSYEGLLVVGDRRSVADALREQDVTAVVVDVGPQRVAVIPREGPFAVADVPSIAEHLSSTCGMPVLAHWMADSSQLSMSVYEAGDVVHRYISDMAHVGDVQETDVGFVRIVDGVAYAEDDPAAPTGPRGADPDAFAPFAVGVIDRARLERLLVGAADYVFVDELHADIISALNLDVVPLTTAFRWIERGEVTIADSVRVGRRPVADDQP